MGGTCGGDIDATEGNDVAMTMICISICTSIWWNVLFCSLCICNGGTICVCFNHMTFVITTAILNSFCDRFFLSFDFVAAFFYDFPFLGLHLLFAPFRSYFNLNCNVFFSLSI